MHRRTLLGLPFATLLLSGCSRSRRQNEVLAWYLRAFVEQDRRLVQQTGYGSWPTGRLVLESRVSAASSLIGWTNLEAVREVLPQVQASAASDLVIRMHDTTPVQLDGSLLPASTRLDYISRERIQALFNNAPSLDRAWYAIHKTYPDAGGWMSFSPVGFSLDREQAVFGVGFSCGPLCGSGVGVLMRRSAAGWVVQQQREAWVS